MTACHFQFMTACPCQLMTTCPWWQLSYDSWWQLAYYSWWQLAHNSWWQLTLHKAGKSEPNSEKFSFGTDRQTDRRKVKVLSCVFAAKNKMGKNTKIQKYFAHNVWCSGVINHSKGSYSGEGIHHLDRFSSTGETTLLCDKTYYWTDLSLQYHNTPIRSHKKYIIIKEIWFLAVIDQLSDTFWVMWTHAT